MDMRWTAEEYHANDTIAALTASFNSVEEVLYFIEMAKRRGNFIRIKPPECENRIQMRQVKDELRMLEAMAGGHIRHHFPMNDGEVSPENSGRMAN